MSNLATRKSKLVFTTSDEIREAGRSRAVIIEAHPMLCMVRLAGLRTSYPISYGAIYHAAVKLAMAEIPKKTRGGRKRTILRTR